MNASVDLKLTHTIAQLSLTEQLCESCLRMENER